MSKKMTNKEEPLKTLLQNRFDDYKHPVRDDLWSAIEQDLFVDKKPSSSKKLFFISLAVAASLVLAFLLIPSFEQDIPPIAIDKTTDTYIATPSIVAPETQAKLETSAPALPTSPALLAVASESCKKTEPNEILLAESDHSTDEVDSPEAEASSEIDEPASANETKDNRGEKYKYYDNLPPLDNESPMEWAKPKTKQKMSLALVAMNSLGDKDKGLDNLSVKASDGSTLEDVDDIRERTVKYDFPISVGFLIRKNLTERLSLETGLTYTYLSSKEDIEYRLRANTSTRIKLHYLGIPLKLNYTLYRTNNLSVYGSLGGMVEKSVAGKMDLTKQDKTETKNLNVSELQWSVSAAVGANYRLTSNWGIFVEPGVGYFFDDGSDVKTIREDKPFNFNLQAGIRFSY